MGCDVVKIGQQAEEEKFQFTHPVWGATIPGLDGELPVYEFQFTHPVWGATKVDTYQARNRKCFNSRTPCGVRLLITLGQMLVVMFQFTHPVWGATGRELDVTRPKDVSIHAPRVGCDLLNCASI